ncbi:Glycerol-3-phosphate dehydrogenase [NAD+] [Wickerhamomyces ciferrii]|uniref:Glycerol-3-phosphate dehydrogenase [NAD(+)] n=1 Tax=Wickerhamomyces ciferrii (strain ATCC 14091 / BCRC 22168 / CBS 111 / JCM 3599 / NBRC 0793 / NRRL Y-1031 F-60-10) TaxID=1206466 RepID=K0KPT4_WICCF|nr:Glycerol-3-phosphate dehydrogenase [NAD+] [Wickerhamomyces ciferrii]CCH45026.1 Glycerol-3-phosphate dehydrogenase [NAD+] [Wickerhamomyces ciferrii]
MSSATQRLSQLGNHLQQDNKASLNPVKPYKITVIGSGNWGTTIAKVVAENAAQRPQLFESRVDMWVYEEEINGQKLTEIINTKHENVKYLPEIKLPENLVANPDIVSAAEGADLLIFNIPHQFLPRIVKQLQGANLKPHARGISCLKGLEVTPEGCELLSTYITENLKVHTGALSGANLAPEVAKEKWSETTVAYTIPNDFQGQGKDIDRLVLKAAFHRPYFHVRVIEDVAGTSLAGALKNVVAIGVGFVEGKEWGSNAAAAIQRYGLNETIKFAEIFFPGETNSDTFTKESAGVADLITTCAGGRNVRVAKHMAITGKPAQEVEAELLNGQSAQGIITAKEVHELLENKNLTKEFPLFEAIYQIVYGSETIDNLPNLIEDDGDLEN